MKRSIKQITQMIRSGKQTSRDIIENFIKEIDPLQSELNSFISLDFERARRRADFIDSLSESEQSSKDLLGVPVAIKDNMLFKGSKTTCGSKILENYFSPYTATAVEKLEEAGAIIVGKTNMDEFAMGSSGETSYYGPVKNPCDIDRIPGGSSSGSAASVASGQVVAALGSDTGGSIRQPASMCGLVGLKPTYGLVSRYGLVAFSSSLDQIGPFATNVDDAAIMLSVIAGHDKKDATSLNIEKQVYSDGLDSGVGGLCAGIPKEYFSEGLTKEISDRVKEIVKKLEQSGVEIKEVSLPLTKYAVAVYYIIAPAEASANLARFDAVKYGYRTSIADNLLDQYMISRQEGFGEEVKRRIMIGTYALSSGYFEAYYLQAQKARTLMKQDFDSVFASGVDFILSPTSPTTAFKLGEKLDDPLKMYLSDIYTISSNLVGIPAMNVPAGRDSAGLPIGIQLMGPYMSEKILLRSAKYIEGLFKE